LQGDTAAFYQSADIYVDSFPLGSTTSLLEAGLYGLPLISRCAEPATCGALCAGSPGLKGAWLHASNLEDFVAGLSRLIEDENLRTRVGERMRRTIRRSHIGESWLGALDGLYERVDQLSRAAAAKSSCDSPRIDELDMTIHRVLCHTGGTEFDRVVRPYYFREATLTRRLRLWLKLLREEGTADPKLLVSEWMIRRLGRWIRNRR
jgi:hypothetical protein